MSEALQTTGGVIRLQADAIYAGSLLRVTVQARQPFTVRVTPMPVQIARGLVMTADASVAAVEKDGVYEVDYVTTDAFVETRVKPGTVEGPACRYGMRFFPFFSSTCEASFAFDVPIVTAVILDLPDDYRMISYRSEVASRHGLAERLHSFGSPRSSYVFRFVQPTDSCACSILLRLGGQSLTELVRYPLGYWLLAMAGLAVLYPESTRIISGAVATLWGFMLREWRHAKSPQQNTLLTRGYVAAGVAAGLWAALWKVNGLRAALAIPLVLVSVWWILRVCRHFEERGELPKTLSSYWQAAIKRTDRSQRNAAERSRSE